MAVSLFVSLLATFSYTITYFSVMITQVLVQTFNTREKATSSITYFCFMITWLPITQVLVKSGTTRLLWYLFFCERVFIFQKKASAKNLTTYWTLTSHCAGENIYGGTFPVSQLEQGSARRHWSSSTLIKFHFVAWR